LIKRQTLTASLVVLGMVVGLSGAALAATGHDHGSSGNPTAEMTLNNGQKWQTDEALRKGMTEIRAAVVASLHPIHEGRFAAADFSTLADKVQEQVDFVVENCKLPADADQQLHFAVAQVLDGIATMKGSTGQEQGVVGLIEALDAYGEHFDHPGWEPLVH
jgi:hypothetical protein